MVMQAFIDDSYNDDSGVYVLAGAIASAENWKNFSLEWEWLLHSGWGVPSEGKHIAHFKYVEMKYVKPKNIPVFINTLEKYITASVVAKINTKDLNSAKSRIFVNNKNINWKEMSPFMMAFRGLMDNFHSQRALCEDVFGEQPIDFYFDEAVQKDLIYSIWDEYLNSRNPNIKKYYGKTPRFHSDDDYMPLQAADLLAGWAKDSYRCGDEAGTEDIISMKMNGFKRHTSHNILHFVVMLNEDALLDGLLQALRKELEPNDFIYVAPKKILTL